MEAHQSGLARLTELARLPGAKIPGRTTDPATSHLVVVSRRVTGLYAVLSRLFEDTAGVDVIQDRRQAMPMPRNPERRSLSATPHENVRGWWIVCCSEPALTRSFDAWDCGSEAPGAAGV